MTSSFPTKARARSRGVTLLELLAVLAIISLAAILFTAAGLRMSERGAAAREAKLFAAALRSAQADAIAQGAAVDFELNVDTGRYGKAGEHAISVATGQQIRFTGARELMATEQSGVIRLYPDGGASGGVIEIESEKEMNRISVDWLTGAITTERIRK